MKLTPNDAAIYSGPMINRRGQEITVAPCTGLHGLVAAIFPDGACIGVHPTSLREIEQLQEAA